MKYTQFHNQAIHKETAQNWWKLFFRESYLTRETKNKVICQVERQNLFYEQSSKNMSDLFDWFRFFV